MEHNVPSSIVTDLRALQVSYVLLGDMSVVGMTVGSVNIVGGMVESVVISIGLGGVHSVRSRMILCRDRISWEMRGLTRDNWRVVGE